MNARQEHRHAHHDHEPTYGDAQRRVERLDDGGDSQSSSPYERAGRAGATQAANREAGWQGDERAAGDSQFAPNAAHTDFRGVGPKGYVRSDERLVEIVCERLTEDPSVDAREVCVTVDDGRVTLTGDIGSRAMKHRVEDIVDACGVREIHNRLRVHPRGGD
jgi:osmotically-inducible protein OsmY